MYQHFSSLTLVLRNIYVQISNAYNYTYTRRTCLKNMNQELVITSLTIVLSN